MISSATPAKNKISNLLVLTTFQKTCLGTCHEVIHILFFALRVLDGTLENTEKLLNITPQDIVYHSKCYLNKVIGNFLLAVRNREGYVTYVTSSHNLHWNLTSG